MAMRVKLVSSKGTSVSVQKSSMCEFGRWSRNRGAFHPPTMRPDSMTPLHLQPGTPVAVAGFDEPMIDVTDVAHAAVGASALIDRVFVTEALFTRCAGRSSDP